MKRKKKLCYYVHHESECAFVGEPNQEGDGLLINVGTTYSPSQKEFEMFWKRMGGKLPIYKLDLTQ